MPSPSSYLEVILNTLIRIERRQLKLERLIKRRTRSRRGRTDRVHEAVEHLSAYLKEFHRGRPVRSQEVFQHMIGVANHSRADVYAARQLVPDLKVFCKGKTRQWFWQLGDEKPRGAGDSKYVDLSS